MSNSDQLPLCSAMQLPELFARDASSKFIALKVKQEGANTALHAIYIGKQDEAEALPFCALVTVTEWDGKTDREEFFIEAENSEQLMEKLERLDEIHYFTFLQVPSAFNIETVSLMPQEMFCLLFPELGAYHKEASTEVLFGLKQSSIALLNRLEKKS